MKISPPNETLLDEAHQLAQIGLENGESLGTHPGIFEHAGPKQSSCEDVAKILSWGHFFHQPCLICSQYHHPLGVCPRIGHGSTIHCNGFSQ